MALLYCVYILKCSNGATPPT